MLSVAEQQAKDLEIFDNIDDLALYCIELFCDLFENHNYEFNYCSCLLNDYLFAYQLTDKEFRKVLCFCLFDD